MRQAALPTPLDDSIVDTALELAEEHGWAELRLHRIADRLGVPVAEIGARFRDLDAMANAWFARARAALLATDPAAFAGQAIDARLALAFGRWLDGLAPHRRVSRDMLRAKLYPSHPHHWVPLIFDLSRLVHDLLDVARVDGSGRLRQAQEVGLTLIALATLRDWVRDDSPGQERTKDRLRRRLAAAGRWARVLPFAASPAPPGEVGNAEMPSTTPPEPSAPSRRPDRRLAVEPRIQGHD
jgi:AcrR family transcriptional regulator